MRNKNGSRVTFKFRLLCLLQSDGDSGDDMIVRSALQGRKDGTVDSVTKNLKLFCQNIIRNSSRLLLDKLAPEILSLIRVFCCQQSLTLASFTGSGSGMLQQLWQRPRSLQIIGNFSIFLQWTEPVASLNKPQ